MPWCASGGADVDRDEPVSTARGRSVERIEGRHPPVRVRRERRAAERSRAYDVLRVAPSATPRRRNGDSAEPRADPDDYRATERGGPTHGRVRHGGRGVRDPELRAAAGRSLRRGEDLTWPARRVKMPRAPENKSVGGAALGPARLGAFILRPTARARATTAPPWTRSCLVAPCAEIYAALGDALAGPELGVEAVASGDAFPKFFEAEDRGAGLRRRN